MFGHLSQPVPALRHELDRQRAVAVEHRPATGLLDDVEGDLGALTEIVGEERCGLEREVPQRIVETAVAHARSFAARSRLG